jgi:predicted tellurium resistance membrane protein TerC
MKAFVTIFLLNLLTSIDNAIVVGGIAQKTRHNLYLIGALSAVLLTICRTALILGVLSIAGIAGFRIALGALVLVIAVRLSLVTAPDDRKEPSLLRLLCVIVVTDLALSLDNILSLSITARDPWVIGFAVLAGLVPLLTFLPLFVGVMSRLLWIQLLAAGFVGELGFDVMTDDKWLLPYMPTGWKEAALRTSVALLVILLGAWRMYRTRLRRRP